MSHLYPEGAPQGFEDQKHIGEPNEDAQQCTDHSAEEKWVEDGELLGKCEYCGRILRAEKTLVEEGHVTVLKWEALE